MGENAAQDQRTYYFIHHLNIYQDVLQQDNTEIRANTIGSVIVGGPQQGDQQDPGADDGDDDDDDDGHLQADSGGGTSDSVQFNDFPTSSKSQCGVKTEEGASIGKEEQQDLGTDRQLEADGGEGTGDSVQLSDIPIQSSPLIKTKPVKSGVSTDRESIVDGPTSSRTQYDTKPEKISQHSDFIVEETARMKIEQNAYREALNILKSLATTLRQQLMMSECYLQVYADEKALECIETIQNVMKTCSRPNVRVVVDLVNSYIDKECYIKAFIMIQYAYKAYVLDCKPNEAVIGIKNMVYDCAFKILYPMIDKGGRTREIASDVGIVTMYKMLATLQEITMADRGVKAYNASCCINDIGTTLLSLSSYQKAIECFEKGLKEVERFYGKNSTKHRVYGHLMLNIGIAHSNLRSLDEAEIQYAKALEVFRKVEDWAYKTEKSEFIKMTERNLESTRRAIGK